MRAVVQRVRRASVTVNSCIASQIGPGLLVFVGVAGDDGPSDVEYIATKIRGLRIFPDADGKMNRSVEEAGGALLVVSQFTLLGDCRKGRRPSFDGAAHGALARPLFDDVVGRLRTGDIDVFTGVFQADMDVELVNDGPVTMLLDSRKQF